jgi:hypothetical protein
MPLATFFRDSENRERLLVKITLGALVIGVALIMIAIIMLGRQQSKDRAQLHDADQLLLRYAGENKARWDAFAEANPNVPVPQVVEGATSNLQSKGVVIISEKQATPTPEPSATPTVAPTPAPVSIRKTRTIIKYRSRPTATPWFHFFKSTR